jgi:hypothetical protein
MILEIPLRATLGIATPPRNWGCRGVAPTGVEPAPPRGASCGSSSCSTAGARPSLVISVRSDVPLSGWRSPSGADAGAVGRGREMGWGEIDSAEQLGVEGDDDGGDRHQDGSDSRGEHDAGEGENAGRQWY